MAYVDSNLNDPGLFFNTLIYTGDDSAKAFTGVGFAPKYLMIKRIDTTGSWTIQDSFRGLGTAGSNDNITFLAETDGAETTATVNNPGITVNSDGWRINSSASARHNASGGTYIYMALA